LSRYYNPISLTLNKRRYLIKFSSTVNCNEIAIEKIKGLRFDKSIENLSDKELKSLKKKLLIAMLNLHNNIEIYHKDIKSNNIFLTGF